MLSTVTPSGSSAAAGAAAAAAASAQDVQPSKNRQVSPTGFVFPSCYSFPPFFTLQRNLDTRKKQLDLWFSLVLNWCRFHRVRRLSVGDALDSDLFRNRHTLAGERRLSPQAAVDVLRDLVRKGRAEWISSSGAEPPRDADPLEAKVWVYWRKPEELADDLLRWINETGQSGQVLTVHELIEGDASKGQSRFFLPRSRKLPVKHFPELTYRSTPSPLPAQTFTASSWSSWQRCSSS